MLTAQIFGTILRALSAIWCVSSLGRIFLGLVGEGPSSNLWAGLFSAVVSVATFKLGTWLKNRPKMLPVAQQLASAKTKWWQSEFGFRLSVFSGAVWAVVAFLWQDDYNRSYSLVFGPSAAVLLIYFGYRYLVVGVKEPIYELTSSKIEELLAAAPSEVAAITASSMNAPESAVPDDSASRDRAMKELIRRMAA